MADHKLYRDKIAEVPNTDHGDSSDEHRGVEIEKSRSAEEVVSAVDATTGGLSGVEKIRATTQAWTKPWLIIAFILSVPSPAPAIPERATMGRSLIRPFQCLAGDFYGFVPAADVRLLPAICDE